MGGWRYGAGRPARRLKTDQVLAIDARRWAREGILGTPGRCGSWGWRLNGEPLASLTYASQGHQVTVSTEQVWQVLEVERTPCHYGGTRAWFRCPTCTRRVAIVYWRGGRSFGCRVCWQLAYRSQSQDALARSISREARITARLTEPGLRPKGMHRKTFARILEEVERCDAAFYGALAVRFGPTLPW
ncbi:MAG: hypothetical protein ACK5PO_07370 [Bacteroidota bacterium]